MNIHVPQSITAKAETENLISVNHMIVSPQSNRPVIGIIQDALLASARMTRRGVFIGRKLAMNTLMRINDYKDPDMETPTLSEPCLMVNVDKIKKEDIGNYNSLNIITTVFTVDVVKNCIFENITRIVATDISKNSEFYIETDIPNKFLKLDKGEEFTITFAPKINQNLLNHFSLCMNGKVFKIDGDDVYISYGGLLMKTNGLRDYKKGDKVSFLINKNNSNSKGNNEGNNENVVDSSIYPLWSGKQIFSLIIPDEINMRKKSNGAPDNDDDMTITDTKVLIEGGELISGIIDKKTVGISDGGIIHVLFNDLGPDRTKSFLNLVQQVANYWILNNSFSIGIGDTIADKKTMDEVDNILDRVKKEVNKLSKNTENMHPDKLEKYINAELNAARDEAGKKAQQNLDNNNNFKATVTAGSKGNTLNISQIVSIVGQQNVEGKRVAYGFKNRTLPHYQKNDVREESRGFVENSYLKGLGPQEYFFHHMAGREGLIDTA